MPLDGPTSGAKRTTPGCVHVDSTHEHDGGHPRRSTLAAFCCRASFFLSLLCLSLARSCLSFSRFCLLEALQHTTGEQDILSSVAHSSDDVCPSHACTHKHTRTRTYTHTHTHTYTHPNTRTLKGTHASTHKSARVHTSTHTSARVHKYTQAQHKGQNDVQKYKGQIRPQGVPTCSSLSQLAAGPAGLFCWC